jgi:hypothetical protein
VYDTLDFSTGAGSDNEQLMVSVMRRAPKGVKCESMKCRCGLGGNCVKLGGSRM